VKDLSLCLFLFLPDDVYKALLSPSVRKFYF
jgi:hypothetical protein